MRISWDARFCVVWLFLFHTRSILNSEVGATVKYSLANCSVGHRVLVGFVNVTFAVGLQNVVAVVFDLTNPSELLILAHRLVRLTDSLILRMFERICFEFLAHDCDKLNTFSTHLSGEYSCWSC